MSAKMLVVMQVTFKLEFRFPDSNIFAYPCANFTYMLDKLEFVANWYSKQLYSGGVEQINSIYNECRFLSLGKTGKHSEKFRS